MVSVQNKGSALAFLFVLLIMCVGAFAAFSALTSGKGSHVVAVESLTPTEALATVSISATVEPAATPAETPPPGAELSTPVAPSPTPVSPITPTPVPTATPTLAPSPTTTSTEPEPPSGSYQFRVRRNEPDCSAGGVIGGRVYDAVGNGLPSAKVYLHNDYGWSANKQSEGPPQAGKYEFNMGSDAGLFHLLVVDEGGQPLSPVVDIDYQPNCSQHVDWERVS